MRDLSFVENRNWGSGLSDGAYGQALATLGLLYDPEHSPEIPEDPDAFATWALQKWMATEAPLAWGPPWRWYRRARWTELMDMVPPELARDMWRAFTDARRDVTRKDSGQPRPVRLQAIAGKMGEGDARQLVQLFAFPESGVDAFSVLLRDFHWNRGWHWPLRVGWLDTPRGLDLADRIRSNPSWFYDDLLRFVDPKGVDEQCDLLLAPPDSLQTPLAKPDNALRASAVLVFGVPPYEVDQRSIQWLADAVRASAVATLPDTDAPEKQAARLFEQITHNEPFDVAAMRGADVGAGSPPAVVFSRGDFLARTRLKTIAWLHAERMAQLGHADVAARMRDAIAQPWFGSESAGASDLARAIEETQADAKEPRYLQASTWASIADKESSWRRVRGFRRGVWHVVDADIAALTEGVTSELEPFPDLELPQQDIPYRLQVVLTAPDCLVLSDGWSRRPGEEPQKGRFDQFLKAEDEFGSLRTISGLPSAALSWLDLPQKGPSSGAMFLLMPLTSQPVEARLSVLHNNRVLQTALLEGPVVATTDEALEAQEGIHLHPEGIVRASLEELDERRRFDAAFIFNHTSNGASHATVIRDGDVKLQDVGGEIQALTDIGDVLVASTERPDDFKNLDSPAVRTLLIDLALKGVKVRNHFVKDTGMPAASEEKPLRRIQILSARPEATVPLEFVYEGYAPDKDAEFCPNHASALKAGSCGKCEHRTGGKYVCCARFWGMSKIIERHQYRTGTPHGDYVRLGEVIGPRNAVPRPERAVVAWSERAADYPGGSQAIAAMEVAVARVVTDRAKSVGTWNDWRTQVQSDPALLIVLPHTDWDGNEALLQIAKEADQECLLDGYIDDRVVGRAEPARIVVLLGCSTADRKNVYAGFPKSFRHAGANIVVATLTDVLGRHAAPAAEALLEGLRECWEDTPGTQALGDVMTRMRRTLLSEKGLPIGMALVAYGDADWRLG